MKRMVWLIAFTAVIGLFVGCSNSTRDVNIGLYSEFIPCDDPDCEICGGDALYDCTECENGTVTCYTCKGETKVDCEGFQFLGSSDCRGGDQYYKNADTGEWFAQECEICWGSGKISDGKTCWNCDGSGNEPCDECGGKGWVSCSTCGGTGTVYCSYCGGDAQLDCGETVYYGWCYNCETRLADDATTCTNCGMNVYVYTCKDCGAIFNEDFETCPDCGNE